MSSPKMEPVPPEGRISAHAFGVGQRMAVHPTVDEDGPAYPMHGGGARKQVDRLAAGDGPDIYGSDGPLRSLT